VLLSPLALCVALFAGGCNCSGNPSSCNPNDCAPGTECDPSTDSCEPVQCIPGFTRCGLAMDGSLQRCNATGDSYTSVGACGAGQSCIMGTSGATCDPPACAPGSSQCQADGNVSYCVVGAFENPIACAAGEVCDPTAGSTCVPTKCGPNVMFCEDGAEVVRLCNALGTSSTVVETCGAGDVCNNGGCFSMCELADLERSFVGCVYMALDTNNTARDDPLQYDIVVSNPSTSLTASVTIETRAGAGGAWGAVATDMVAPQTIRIFALADRHAEGSSLTTALAYRITASIPIVAYQFNSDDLSGSAGSSGATILLPKPALDKLYYAISLPQSVGDDALFGFGGEQHHSGFAVVGAFDGTNVTVTVNANTGGGPGIPAMTPGGIYNTTINEGDVLQIESANIGDDVTGSYVTADQSIAMFGYHECAVLTPGTCDHFEEELMPLTAWGMTFANARMYAGTESHLWRFLASEDNTNVSFEYDAGVTGLPPSGTSVVMNQGQYADYIVDGPAMVGFAPGPGNIGDYYAFADKPIYVVQFSMDEVHMVTSVPVDQWLPQYLFIAPPFFGDNMTVVRYMTSTVTLDGMPIPAGMWSSAGAGYEAYRTALTDGSHFITGSAVSEFEGPPEIYISGEDSNCGYCYVGGLNVEQINPVP
jgi:hypothetical protein